MRVTIANCDDMSSGQQHWKEHKGPARSSAPTAMCEAEAKGVNIRRYAKRGQCGVIVAAVETPLFDGRDLPDDRDKKRLR